MRPRLPIGRTLFFAAAAAFAAIALLPLRLGIEWLGLAERGLAARAATGSVWAGGLNEAQLGPVPLGDVSARLNLAPLLIGRVRLSLERPGDDAPFAAAVTASRHGFGIDDASGRLRLGALFAPLPLSALDFDDVSAGFAGGRCARAEGRVRVAVSGAVAGALAGVARCAEDALLLPLVSATGMERLDLRFFADGRYRIDLIVRPADPAAAARLAAAGLRPAGNGYAMRLDGVL